MPTSRQLARAAVLLGVASSALLGPRVRGQAPRPDVVVSAEWLRAHLADPDLVVLALGMPSMPNVPEPYAAGHVPGARLLDFHAIAGDAGGPAGLTMEMPPADSVRRLLESLGVSDRSRVVLYGPSAWASPVARAFVTLDWLGLGDRTSVLDGGLGAWKAAGGALDTTTPAVARGRLSARPTRDVVVDGAWMRAHFADAGQTVLDARAPQFYTGAEQGHRSTRSGHIPGARNLYFTTLVDSTTNRYRSPDEARALFARAGVPTDRPLVVYCHIGQTASVAYLQARRVGVPVKLYDGSFQGWSKDPAWPVVLGEKP
jgi:thiosulfate/3-mercaptopyruvate sulfurtransferase